MTPHNYHKGILPSVRILSLYLTQSRIKIAVSKTSQPLMSPNDNLTQQTLAVYLFSQSNTTTTEWFDPPTCHFIVDESHCWWSWSCFLLDVGLKKRLSMECDLLISTIKSLMQWLELASCFAELHLPPQQEKQVSREWLLFWLLVFSYHWLSMGLLANRSP